MSTVAGQRVSVAAVGLAGLLALAVNFVIPPEHALAALLGLGGAAAFALYAVRGDLLAAVLAWFLSLICFDLEFWRLVVPGFFNLTIPRLLLAAVTALLFAMLLVGRFRGRLPKRTSLLMLALLGYFTISAAASGFDTIAVATVHYRLIGGYWFAVAVFFLMLHAVRDGRHLDRIAWFFFAVGLYLTYTGWCERFRWWDGVFPSYIADPSRGIHWGRSRGPFLVSPMLGVALLFCLFSNLYLARRTTTLRRWGLYAASGAMLPVLLWTQTRSVWLAAIVCTAIWLLSASRTRPRVVIVSVMAAAAVVAVTVNWANIASPERARGGVTEMEPIHMRMGLALITMDMAADRPLFGVGFGHFRDHAARYARDPSSPAYAFASTAMEHNNFLSVLAETGAVGLALYVWLLAHLLRQSVRLWRRMPPDFLGGRGRDFLVLYWALFANHLTDAMFRETSVHPFDNCLFFGISGAVAALAMILDERRAAATAAA